MGEIVWNGRKIPFERPAVIPAIWSCREVNHQLFTESVLDEVLISMGGSKSGAGRRKS